MSDADSKANKLKAAIAGLEAQRTMLGDAVVEPAIAALRQQLAHLDSPGPVVRAEERKVVTILFVDVSGFTALAEKLDPEEVRNLINGCFDELVPIVQKYGGTIDKFIGDEIMALFGAPVAHENDPERALRSALEMMTGISSFNQRRRTELSLHIGINTGPVVTGAVGSQGRKDYSVMGDAVNLAARLEDASGDGEIYVGPITYRLTSSLFDFEWLDSLQLKGKSEQQSAYRLVGLKTAPKPARGIEGMRSDLIGRQQQLEQIHRALQNARHGVGGVVAVTGEAGVGKSRLICEGLAGCGPEVCLAEGRALSHTTGISYWMARDILRGLLRTSQDGFGQDVEQALRRCLQEVAPAPLEEIFPYLATLLQIPLEPPMLDRVRFLSSEALQRRILDAVTRYLTGLARLKPVVLFWEDLHWADPSSLLLLETILPFTTKLPLLLVLAYRPEEADSETFQAKAHRLGAKTFHLVKLLPLSAEQSASLVESLLKIETLPPTIRKLVVDRSDGNPFFIEELLRSLLDSGAVVIQNHQLVATGEIEAAGLPETVQGVVASRIDRLSAEKKNLLQAAAVIGRSFQRKVLQQITSFGDTEGFDAELADLARRDFIYRGQNGLGADGDYIFKHAITQDVAYQGLLKARRKELHEKVGHAIETLFPGRLTELSATLGYHFELAENREKAFRYLAQAGQHAQKVFGNAEAAGFYRSAISQGRTILETNADEGTTRRLAYIYESLGDVLDLSGRGDEARESYDASAKLVLSADRVSKSRLKRKIGSTYTVQRRYPAMTEAYDAAENELGDTAAEPVNEWWHEKMQILLARMHLLYWQGMSDEMTQLAETYKAVIEQKGRPIERGKFYQMLGLSDLTRSRYVASERAVRLAELAVSTSQGSPELVEAAHIRFTAGLTRLFRGNLVEAINHCQAALSLAKRVGDLVVQARCLSYLTVAHRRSGDNDMTRRYAQSTETLATQLGMVEYIAMAKANLAWLAWREERFQDVQSLGCEALTLWHGMEDPYGVDWQALLPLLALAVAQGRIEDAVGYVRGLFGENQHPIPPALAAAATVVISSTGNQDAAATRTNLDYLVAVAKQIAYL
jgi:predicted ATPase/class 3 adenylate cyclase